VPEGLIIVESPAKARTLKRFLGDRFDVLASMGHVRDLPGNELAVDVDAGFKPHYEVVESRKKTIGELRTASKGEREVILASDPDREGEAIAWHLSEVLKLRSPKRIEFHEITAEAVRRALESPRDIDMRLVNAQQARRVVDRLVGYRLSPFLWSKVQKGIGAGRVSSVALRLVVDREEEIRKFVPVESWTIDVELAKQAADQHFFARLNRLRNEAAEADTNGDGEGETKADTKPKPRRSSASSKAPATRSSASRRSAGRRAPTCRTSPRPCNRTPRAGCASRPAAPCAWRRTFMKASSSATRAPPA